jgi:hypothetical protein
MANKIEVQSLSGKPMWIIDKSSPGSDAGGEGTTPVYPATDPNLEVVIDTTTKKMRVTNPNVIL